MCIFHRGHMTGVKPKVGGSGCHVFRSFDWTIIPVIAFNWLSKSVRNAPYIWRHLSRLHISILKMYSLVNKDYLINAL